MVRKRSRSRTQSAEDLNVWPSFTDLMSNAFMIISLFLLLALFRSLFLKSTAEETQINLSETEREVAELRQEISALENELEQKTENANDIQTLLQQSNNRISVLESENRRLKSAPPVVVIQDSGEYQFDSGSAELPKGLQKYIVTDLVDRIERIVKQRNLYYVEIIGHTDGQINANSPSNLDEQLEGVAEGDKPVSNLRPGSNADLGLMRALEVVKQLQQIQKTGRLKGVQFHAYSAAQLILPSGEFAPVNRKPDANRRRIEIRFSPLGRAETVN